MSALNMRPNDPNRLLPNLDGFRALACMLVLASHLPLPVASKMTGLIGSTGVGLFFTLSGFLMGHLYGSRNWTVQQAAQYGIARFSRIAPIYWAVITLCVILSYLIADPAFEMRIQGGSQIARHYLFGGSVSIFWSISPEVQYYVFFVFVWWALATWRKVPAVLSLLAGVCVLLLLTHNAWPGLSLPNKLHFFLFGTLAGMLPRVQPTTRSEVNGIAAMQVVALLLVFGLFFFYPEKDLLYSNVEVGLLYAFAIYAISFNTPWSAMVFANAPMRRIGHASFSIYLLHILVYYFLGNALGLDRKVFEPLWIVVALMGLAIPMLVSHFIEIPLQRVVRNLLENRVLHRVGRFKPAPVSQPSASI